MYSAFKKAPQLPSVIKDINFSRPTNIVFAQREMKHPEKNKQILGVHKKEHGISSINVFKGGERKISNRKRAFVLLHELKHAKDADLREQKREQILNEDFDSRMRELNLKSLPVTRVGEDTSIRGLTDYIFKAPPWKLVKLPDASNEWREYDPQYESAIRDLNRKKKSRLNNLERWGETSANRFAREEMKRTNSKPVYPFGSEFTGKTYYYPAGVSTMNMEPYRKSSPLTPTGTIYTQNTLTNPRIISFPQKTSPLPTSIQQQITPPNTQSPTSSKGFFKGLVDAARGKE
jgi:hypothetical protein